MPSPTQEWSEQRAVEELIKVLRACGHTVEALVTGALIIDSTEYDSEAVERLARACDGELCPVCEEV